MTLAGRLLADASTVQPDEATFACPSCGSLDLVSDRSSIRCQACDRSYLIRDGIPVFREGQASFNWGLAADKLSTLVPRSQEIGWHDAMMDLLSEVPLKEASLIWKRTLGPHKLAMSVLLPIGPESKILDLGSGWGTISLNLAQSCGLVVSMDQMFEHLEWQRAASSALGVDNITYVQAGDTKSLPFPSQSFDAVIMNGVLEWVASNATGDPQEVQQGFLKEVARILKPAGVLFVGIENRWNHKYFRGVPEGHIQMKYGALLPRWMTDLYLRRIRGVPYREYTYTLFGYRKLLSKAGLRNRRFYVPRPHYGQVEYLLPLVQEGDLFPQDWTVETRRTFSRRPESYFAHTYLMTATPRDDAPGVVDKVVREVSTRLGLSTPVTLEDSLFSVTPGGKAMLHVRGDEGTDYLARIGLVRTASDSVRRHHKAVSALQDSDVGTTVKDRLPVTLFEGDVGAHAYSVEVLDKGQNGDDLIKVDSARDRILEDGLGFVTALSSLGQRLPMNDDLFDRHVSDPIKSVRDWFTKAEWGEYGTWLSSVESALHSRFAGNEIVIAPRHGDLTPDNCLASADGSLLKVLDWEHYEPKGLPMLDWVIFLGRAYRPDVKREMKAKGQDPDAIRIHGYPDIFMEGLLNEHLKKYLDALNLEHSLLEPLLFMWWIKLLQDWKSQVLYHPEWRRLRLYPVMERLKTLAGVL